MALTQEDRDNIDKLDPISKRNQLVKLVRAQCADMERILNELEEMGVDCSVSDETHFLEVEWGPSRVLHRLHLRAAQRL